MKRPQDVLKKCREAFEQFDMDGSGTIEPWELKVTLRLANARKSCSDDRRSAYVLSCPVRLMSRLPCRKLSKRWGRRQRMKTWKKCFLSWTTTTLAA